jgi:hypothetical protein
MFTHRAKASRLVTCVVASTLALVLGPAAVRASSLDRGPTAAVVLSRTVDEYAVHGPTQTDNRHHPECDGDAAPAQAPTPIVESSAASTLDQQPVSMLTALILLLAAIVGLIAAIPRFRPPITSSDSRTVVVSIVTSITPSNQNIAKTVLEDARTARHKRR